MQAVTKFYAGSQEVDMQKSVQASILASTAPFTIAELAQSIVSANPQDKNIQDVEIISRQVRRFVEGIHTNRYTGSMYICDAVGDGRYVRHGVAIEQPQAEVVVEPVVESVQEVTQESVSAEALPQQSEVTYTLKGVTYQVAVPATQEEQKRLQWVAEKYPRVEVRKEAKKYLEMAQVRQMQGTSALLYADEIQSLAREVLTAIRDRGGMAPNAFLQKEADRLRGQRAEIVINVALMAMGKPQGFECNLNATQLTMLAEQAKTSHGSILHEIKQLRAAKGK